MRLQFVYILYRSTYLVFIMCSCNHVASESCSLANFMFFADTTLYAFQCLWGFNKPVRSCHGVHVQYLQVIGHIVKGCNHKSHAVHRFVHGLIYKNCYIYYYCYCHYCTLTSLYLKNTAVTLNYLICPCAFFTGTKVC